MRKKSPNSAKPDLSLKKVPAVQPKSTQAQLLAAADALLKSAAPAKKKPGRPPNAPAVAGAPVAAAPAAAVKRAKKAKDSKLDGDEDMSDIEAEFAEEPAVVDAATATTTEKVKPLRMKISKAKERALMKEFGLDETVLSEGDMQERRQRLQDLIQLGKPRGYLTRVDVNHLLLVLLSVS